MKLASRVINEVLNSSQIYLIEKRPSTQADMDTYQVIVSRRGNVGRVVIPTKGDKYRPIEVVTKASLGSHAIDVFGKEGKIEHLLKGKLSKELADATVALNLQFGRSGSMESLYAAAIKATSIKIKKDHGWMSKEQFYLWLINEGVLDIVAKQFFPNLVNIEIEDKVTKHGKIDLIGFDEKKHKDLISVLDKAEDALNKSGFKTLVYGKVFLVPKKSSGRQTVLADYLHKDDTMRIFDIGIKSAGAVRTVVHELGHRYYYKDLSTQARVDIMKMYHAKLQDLRSTSREKPAFAVGDKVTTAKYGEVEYTGYKPKSLYGRVYSHQFRIFKDGKQTTKYLSFSTLEEAAIYFNTTKDYASMDNTSSGNPWVPTTYSMTSDKEWFAEVFSFAVMDNNKEVLEWIKGLK